VTTSNGTTTGQIQWSGIQSLLETERLFLVQLAGYRRAPFIVLAKRGLADPSQVDNLRALVNAGIASAR
jgi:YcxB-like protein